MSNSFTHLSISSGYSFKYGSAHPEQLIERAAQFNMTSLALTDQNNLAGAIRFAQSCESFGIKPILGITLSFIQKSSKITLLAKSGCLSSLYRLVSGINTNTSDGVLTIELLERFNQYSKDLVALLGPQSSLNKNLTNRKEAAALSNYQLIKELFEPPPHGLQSHLDAALQMKLSPCSRPVAYQQV